MVLMVLEVVEESVVVLVATVALVTVVVMVLIVLEVVEESAVVLVATVALVTVVVMVIMVLELASGIISFTCFTVCGPQDHLHTRYLSLIMYMYAPCIIILYLSLCRDYFIENY